MTTLTTVQTDFIATVTASLHECRARGLEVYINQCPETSGLEGLGNPRTTAMFCFEIRGGSRPVYVTVSCGPRGGITGNITFFKDDWNEVKYTENCYDREIFKDYVANGCFELFEEILPELEKQVIVYHAAFERCTYKAAVVTVPGDLSDEAAVMEAYRKTQNVRGSWSGPEQIRDEDLMTDYGPNPDYSESVTVVGGRRDLSESQRGFRSTSMGDLFIVQGKKAGMRYYGLGLSGAVRFPDCGAFLRAKRPATPGDRMSAPYGWDKGVFA